MKALVLLGMLAALVAAVIAFATGLVLLGYAAIGAGVLWLALAGGQARPSRWAPAETEHDRRRRHG